MLNIEGPFNFQQTVEKRATATGFVEGSTYFVSPSYAHDTVYVDESPLARRTGQSAWEWNPCFYAGKVTVEVLDKDQELLGLYYLDVGPSPDKVGELEFRSMCSDIMSIAPRSLFGSGADFLRFGNDESTELLEVAYSRIRRHSAACLTSLLVLEQRPLERYRPQRRMVMPHQVRKVDVRSVKELARTSIAPSFIDADCQTDSDFFLLTVPHRQSTYDHAANRTIAAMVDRLLARLSDLQDRLANVRNSKDELLVARVPRRMKILRDLTQAFRRTRRSTVFGAVARSEITAAGLNAISSNPDYARAFQHFTRALSLGFSGDDLNDALPTGPTWQIYELWCFLQVQKAFRALTPTTSWTRLTNGSGQLRPFTRGNTSYGTVRIYLQPAFNAWDKTKEGRFRSLSGQRKPDIVITLENAQTKRFIVLDAKYRTTRENVLDAMQSAHIYQNCLTWNDKRPDGSFLLIPKGGSTRWLEDLEFHSSFQVGLFELTRDRHPGPLIEFFRGFLSGKARQTH